MNNEPLYLDNEDIIDLVKPRSGKEIDLDLFNEMEKAKLQGKLDRCDISLAEYELRLAELEMDVAALKEKYGKTTPTETGSLDRSLAGRKAGR